MIAPEPTPRQTLTDRILCGEWTRHRVDLKAEEPRLGAEYDRLTAGVKSLSHYPTRQKWLDTSVWPCSDWELAEQYIRHIWEEQEPRRKRVGWDKRSIELAGIPQALYFPGPSSGHLAHVDLKAAYWQLYSPLALDLKFKPWAGSGGSIGGGRIRFLDADWLYEEKLVRNALIGICRARNRTEVKDGRKQRVARHNKYLAPELWGYIALTLHAVAAEIRERFDLRYVHTDGYIVPAAQARKLQGYLWREWGLPAEIDKESRAARVRAIGNYGFGASGGAGPKSMVWPEPIDNIRPPETYNNDLRRNLKRWRLWALESYGRE